MPCETHCPLCADDQSVAYHSDKRRHYLQCSRCQLVFVPPRYHLDAAAERAVYDLHRNDPRDPAYRAFLSRLTQPLLANIGRGAVGLDFGCGPGPALATMLREAGLRMAVYDPLYAPDSTVLNCQYDVITATEVVEHLHAPGRELEALWGLIRPGGWLGIMTKLVTDQPAFARWHYIRDPTHVCFFSSDTWRWWAQQHGARYSREGSDVMLLQKPCEGLG